MIADGKSPAALFEHIFKMMEKDSDITTISEKKFVTKVVESDSNIQHILENAPNFMQYVKKWKAWHIEDNVLYSDGMLDIIRRMKACYDV